MNASRFVKDVLHTQYGENNRRKPWARTTARKGKFRGRSAFERRNERGPEAVGMTPDIMCRTFASLLVSADGSLYKVAIWLGDELQPVEKHYAKLSPADTTINKAWAERRRKAGR